jgi:hypothetical protein
MPFSAMMTPVFPLVRLSFEQHFVAVLLAMAVFLAWFCSMVSLLPLASQPVASKFLSG